MSLWQRKLHEFVVYAKKFIEKVWEKSCQQSLPDVAYAPFFSNCWIQKSLYLWKTKYFQYIST